MLNRYKKVRITTPMKFHLQEKLAMNLALLHVGINDTKCD